MVSSGPEVGVYIPTTQQPYNPTYLAESVLGSGGGCREKALALLIAGACTRRLDSTATSCSHKNIFFQLKLSIKFKVSSQATARIKG